MSDSTDIDIKELLPSTSTAEPVDPPGPPDSSTSFPTLPTHSDLPHTSIHDTFTSSPPQNSLATIVMSSPASSTVNHSSFLINQIPKLSDSNRVDWNLGLKTYLKSRRLCKYVNRGVTLTSEEQRDEEKVECLESEWAGVLEVIRATITTSRLAIIRGIEDPKLAYETLLAQTSQDDGLEVAALIARVSTTRYNGSESMSGFLDSISDLHTRLAEATSVDPNLKISDKLLAVFLLLSFPSEQFSTIRDQMFGNIKHLSTSKVLSRLRTKSVLNTVDEVPIAMNATTRETDVKHHIAPRTDRSANAPCVLREHWQFSHTNGSCSKQRCQPSSTLSPHHRNYAQTSVPRSNPTMRRPVNSQQLSDDEKIRRFNQLAAAGVIGFNADANQTRTLPVPIESPSVNMDEPTISQFATSYNATIEKPASLVINQEFSNFSRSSRATIADTGCNRHMFGDSTVLTDLIDIEPIWIDVANADQSSRVAAHQMGTVKLNSYSSDGSPTVVNIWNVLYSPSLPANLISITQLYDEGYRFVDPNYGKGGDDCNIYLSNGLSTIPAYRAKESGSFWLFSHNSEPFKLQQMTL